MIDFGQGTIALNETLSKLAVSQGGIVASLQLSIGTVIYLYMPNHVITQFRTLQIVRC
jgi:hypothetical protein